MGLLPPSAQDGATVDVFSSAQFGAERLLAYKTYEVGENDHALRELVAYELGIYPKMGGRYGTIALLDAFMTRRGDVCLVFPYIAGDHTPTTAAAIQARRRAARTPCGGFSDAAHARRSPTAHARWPLPPSGAGLAAPPAKPPAAVPALSACAPPAPPLRRHRATCASCWRRSAFCTPSWG